MPYLFLSCQVNFDVAVKGPELLNKYIGASEAAVRSLFELGCPNPTPYLYPIPYPYPEA